MLKALQIKTRETMEETHQTADFCMISSPDSGHESGCTSPFFEGSCDYNPFHDYLGLSKIVHTMRDEAKESRSNTPPYSLQQQRRDSLSSASSSELSGGSSNGLEFGDSNDVFGMPHHTTEYHTHLYNDEMLFQIANTTIERPLPPSSLLERGSVSVRVPTRPMKQQVCVFCRNNGESDTFYTSHCLKDSEGKVTCPVLRAYTCPLCGANGDLSHTIKYCPENSQTSKLQIPQVKRATITITRKK